MGGRRWRCENFTRTTWRQRRAILPKTFDTLNAAGNGNPIGIWSDGTTMWVDDFSDDKLYAYNLATKARDSSKDFDTLSAAGNNNPYGAFGRTGPQCGWPTFNDDKLYAYNLATKERDSSKDFDTLNAAGNNTPFGLWSDGTTMWVADEVDDKLYAYELAEPNTAPTVTLSAPTSPVDGSATQTLYWHVLRRSRQRHRHNHHCRQPGHAGRRHEGRCGGHVGSRLHRAGQHHLRTDRHRHRHGNRRWQPDRHCQPKRYDSGNGFDAVLASNFQSVGNGRHCI